jgi:hypothetical protein
VAGWPVGSRCAPHYGARGMRRLLLVYAVALALPATAGAAPLRELPFVERTAAGCLAPTGVPGGLSIGGAYSPRDVTTEFLTAGPDGAAPVDGVSVGRLYACAAVAEAQDGTAVVAGGVEPHAELDGFAIHAAVRDRGGAFGAPVALGRGDPAPAVAVGPAGHAVVAWVQRSRSREAIVAARRVPGEAFGPPESVLAWRSRGFFSLVELRAGVDAAGRVTLLWGRDLPASEQTRVEAASAVQGTPFAVQRLASRAEFPDPVLAVAPDGWALAAHRDWGRSGGAIFERAPGAPNFTRVALRPPRDGDQPVVAIRDGGGALVGWRRETPEKIEVATREQAGAFGKPNVVARGWAINEIVAFDPFTSRSRLLLPPVDLDDARLRAALAPDGRALLAWSGAAGRPPLWAGSAHAVFGRLGGAFEPARRLGGTLRDTDDVAPVFLPDGRAAVAWSDRAGRGNGRLHLAVEGAPALATEPIRLRLRAPRFQRLTRRQSPRVTAVCSGPCDVRAAINILDGDGFPRSVTNAIGGALRLHLGRVQGLGRQPRWVKVRGHAGPPGGRATAVRTLRLRLARR